MFRALQAATVALAVIIVSPAILWHVPHAVAASKTGKKEKVNIDADNMEVFDKDNKVVFTGHVKAVKGETTLYTDHLEVFTEKEKQPDGTEKTKARHLVAIGHVRIVKPNVTITGKRADMDVKKDIVVVTGDVLVKKPTATIRGDKLIANLKTDVTKVITKGKKRVHGIFDQ